MKRGFIWVVILLLAPIVGASQAGQELLLPAIGNGAGSAGTSWNTTIWVKNHTLKSTDVLFRFLPRGAGITEPLEYETTIPSGWTMKMNEPIETMFSTEGFGALLIDSDEPIYVASRIYSVPEGGEERDSTGQLLTAVPRALTIGKDQKTYLLGLQQTRPYETSQFRYNLGLIETEGEPVSIQLVVLDDLGYALLTKTLDLGGWAVQQFAISDLFPDISVHNSHISIKVLSGSGRVAAYGSLLSNGANDPSTFEMLYLNDLSSVDPGSGTLITSIVAGDGLQGGGTEGEVVLDVGVGMGIQVDSDSISVAVPMILSGQGGPIIQATNLDDGTGVKGISSGQGSALSAGAGLEGVHQASGNYGYVGTRQYGVFGWSMANTGVFGESYAGKGVDGVHRHSGNQGSLGTSTAGVQGDSTFALGVLGISQSSNGVKGISVDSFGVFGASENISAVAGRTGIGSNYDPSGTLEEKSGVWGDSSIGTGVVGSSGAFTGNGVYAISLGDMGNGVYSRAEGINGTALMAVAAGSATSAGHFIGNVDVTGMLTKGGGSFKIDHPLDPTNMYLYHSFVESPDMMNIYNGNITTSHQGLAVVCLPEYFDALNMDFKYQLTVIGTFSQAIIAEEISNNCFTIKTDKTFVKVSWQVTGIRKDRWAEENRIQVEEIKPVIEQGKLLHPLRMLEQE